MHLLNRAIITECEAAAELYWLVQLFSADFAREMFKAQWRPVEVVRILQMLIHFKNNSYIHYTFRLHF